ncbi:MAG: hypothetical protein IPJ84_20570 [Bdellovibrionales bacterium]|nr:hypothetical protein [Bdellovibrionales bacterium]
MKFMKSILGLAAAVLFVGSSALACMSEIETSSVIKPVRVFNENTVHQVYVGDLIDVSSIAEPHVGLLTEIEGTSYMRVDSNGLFQLDVNGKTMLFESSDRPVARCR